MTAVFAPLVAAVITWRMWRWGSLRLGFTVAVMVVGSLALSACQSDPADGSARRQAGAVAADVLTEPGDPPLIVTRVYQDGRLRCFEASVEWRAGGESHEKFQRDCATPDDPADQRAYVARQRVGQRIKD